MHRVCTFHCLSQRCICFIILCTNIILLLVFLYFSKSKATRNVHICECTHSLIPYIVADNNIEILVVNLTINKKQKNLTKQKNLLEQHLYHRSLDGTTLHQKLNTGWLTGPCDFWLDRISFSIPSNSIIFSMSSCSFMCTSLSLCSGCSGSL